VLNKVLIPAFLFFHVAGISVLQAEHASSSAQTFQLARGTHHSAAPKGDTPRYRQKRIAENPTVISPVTCEFRPIPFQAAALPSFAEQLVSGVYAPTLSRAPPAVL
jgi:hypothetical protein